MVTERDAMAHQILQSHQECIDLGVGGPPVQRLCLEYKSNESAELYTKKVPHHGQREGTKRNTRTLGFLILHQYSFNFGLNGPDFQGWPFFGWEG